DQDQPGCALGHTVPCESRRQVSPLVGEAGRDRGFRLERGAAQRERHLLIVTGLALTCKDKAPEVAEGISSVPGAMLRAMDTFSDISAVNDRLPLSEADQTALRSAILHDLGALPFIPGAL